VAEVLSFVMLRLLSVGTTVKLGATLSILSTVILSLCPSTPT